MWAELLLDSMAGKRTKKQKQKTSVRRTETLAYSISEIKAVANITEEKQEELIKSRKSIVRDSNFDPKFVFRDLIKTIIVTVLVVSVLVAYTIFGQ